MSERQIYAKYGLPLEVKFCKKCVMSNQRPASTPEFRHIKDHKKTTLAFDEDGVCDACRYAELKDGSIDWKKREEELIRLLNKHRRNDGYYDILVPGSGGKDSVKAAHILKYKYGMHPLTVTWPPHIYTEIGWKNFRRWIDVGGFDNVTYSPNGKVHRLLTKLAVENLFHPFQPFIIGQKNIAPALALKFGIKLVFYGENEAEYGNPINDNLSAKRDLKYYAAKRQNLSDLFLSGVSVEELVKKYDLSINDLDAYLPLDPVELQKAEIDVRYLGYYLKWTPQESYYYAVEHIGFEVNPERTEGTFSKYNSLDDRIDGLHYWATYIKFGLGRASYEASQEIRNHHLTRQEGVMLVKKFDGEFPKKYFKEILEYVQIDEDQFFKLADKFRSPHLWEKVNGRWALRYKIT